MDTEAVSGRAHRIRLVTAAALAAAALVVGVVVGLFIGRAQAPLPQQCVEALTAARAVAAAVESEWATASAAVDAVQSALAETRFNDLAAECLD